LALHFLFHSTLSPVAGLPRLVGTNLGTDPTSAATTDTGNSTFTFNDKESTFECTRNPRAGWTACASADSLTALPAAMKRLVVASWDAAGNLNPEPAAASVPVDPLPFKTVLLTSSPEPDVKTTTSRMASFSFQSERGVGFQCSLDYAAWARCEGSVFLYELAVGPHTFLVRAVDDAGNVDPSPATKSWIIE
jgi:hypothetical protein